MERCARGGASTAWSINYLRDAIECLQNMSRTSSRLANIETLDGF